MMGFDNAISARRGEDNPLVGRWLAAGEQYRTGTFTIAILRGEHPDEPVLTEYGPECVSVEVLKDGAQVTLALTAEDIARAQGPRRPVIEHLIYRLRHEGADTLTAFFIVFPMASDVEAQRCIGSRKGASE